MLLPRTNTDLIVLDYWNGSLSFFTFIPLSRAKHMSILLHSVWNSLHNQF